MAIPPFHLTPSELAKLQPYQDALPANEWAAFSSWLTTFYPFQREWLLEPADYAVINKSRQIGLSHSTAAQLVIWGVFHGETTTVVSVGDREAAEVLDKAKRHRDVLVMLGSTMARSGGRNNATEISFRSGGRVVALPSTAGRGFTGHVFLDEFAYHQHPEKVWDGAMAVTMLGFRARVASTPNGIGNDFHALWSDPEKNKGWAKYEVSLERAIGDGYPVNEEKCWQLAKGDPRIFDQLFRCKFLDNEQQYIPTAAIEACTVDDTYSFGGECFAGLDLGRTSDRTELQIIRKDDLGILWCQHTETCKRTDFSDIERLASVAFGSPWYAKRLCVDSTGLGAFPAEQLQKRHGRTRVEPVVFTLQSKEDMATALFSAFVEHRIRIPRSDTTLRDELCSIRRIVTSAGNIRYDAPQTDAGHADRAWALALAVHATTKPGSRRHEVYGNEPQAETTITIR